MYNKRINKKSLIKFMEENGYHFIKNEVDRNKENKITYDYLYFANDTFKEIRVTFSRLDATYSFCWQTYNDSALQCGWKLGYNLREFKNNFLYKIEQVKTIYC